MDKIQILEKINEYNAQNVHLSTRSGRSYTGQLNVVTLTNPSIHRVLEIGWRQERVEVQSVLTICRT
jgi:hypothetical protein